MAFFIPFREWHNAWLSNVYMKFKGNPLIRASFSMVADTIFVRTVITVVLLLAASRATGQEADTGTTADTLISIDISVTASCENNRSRISWNLSTVDSALRPMQLLLQHRSYGTTRFIDSNAVALSTEIPEEHDVWVIRSGYYRLYYHDTLQHRRYTSNELQVKNCPLFLLPETVDFRTETVYKPKEVFDIERIDFTVFNAMGEEVFSTSDPLINWDGKNKITGVACEAGNYFYYCDIFEKTGENAEKRNVTGIIEIIR